MTSIVGSIVNGGSGDSTFTLTNGSTSGRAIVVLATQSRNPATLAGSDFNIETVAPSQTLGVATSATNGEDRTLAMVWSDADLPVSGGTYTLSSSAALSTRYSIYELSDADTDSIEVISAGLATGFAGPLVVNFSATNAESVLFLSFRQSQDFGGNIGAGDATDQTVDNVDPRYYIGHEVDADADAQMSLDDGLNNAGDGAYTAIAINSLSGGGTTPTITDINTNNEFTPGAANTLNGTNLSTTGGSISIDGEAQTITNRTSTAITFTGVRGGNPYNTDLTLTYTDADSNEVTQTVQQVPAAGFAVTAASPNTTDDASLWTGLVDTSTGDPVTVVDGDQALVTDPNSLGNLAVTPAGEISADTEGDFTVQFWRASEGVWGSDQTVTFEAPETPSLTVLGKGNTTDMRVFAAAGITKGSHNLRAIKYFRSNGATSRQYNHAQKQFEDS